jgi:hypothetical protein
MVRLTTRNCDQCDSELDIAEDKYFTKRKNQNLFMILNVILYPALRGSYFKPKVRLICEACNRNNKIKNLGI